MSPTPTASPRLVELEAQLAAALEAEAKAGKAAAAAAEAVASAEGVATAATKKRARATARVKAARKELAAARRRGRGVPRARRKHAQARARAAEARKKLTQASAQLQRTRRTSTATSETHEKAKAHTAALRAQVEAERERLDTEPAPGGGVPLVSLMVDRFTGGYTPAQVAQVEDAGGALAWFDAQLAPDDSEHATVTALPTWFPVLTHTPQERFRNENSGAVGAWDYAQALGNATLLRRIHTHWPVREMLTEFFSDHLHVPATADGWYWRQDHDRLIRSMALGKFSDLLVAASLHPAMLYYLGNFSSTATTVNENHARELLELHTLGVGFHDEDDVKASGRILSGWTVDPWGWPKRTFEAHYDDTLHHRGRASVAGFTSDGSGRDGQTAKDYLAHLARHPNTARRLMRKLATRLVSDDPSARLVSTLTGVYLEADTAIAPVLRTLVRDEEFLASAHHKVRTEENGFVATMRALSVTVRRPRSDEDAAHNLVYSYSAPGPYMWPRPDGRPDAAHAHSDPGRILRSFTMHADLLGGWWPTGNVDYLTPGELLPDLGTGRPLAQLVTHLSRRLTGRDPSPALMSACAQAVGMSPDDVVEPESHQASHLRDWLGARLISPILDQPLHLTH